METTTHELQPIYRPLINSWDWQRMPDDTDPYFGFVYLIKNVRSGMSYAGKKLFTKKMRRKPLKGKKVVRLSRVCSDWEKYFGSSALLLASLERDGKHAFTREVIALCGSPWECAYVELQVQMATGALFRKDYWNSLIHIRLNQPPMALDLVAMEARIKKALTFVDTIESRNSPTQ